MKQLHVITDMQYGSCGKGLFAGLLAKELCPDTLVTAWGPNAGHTVIDTDGRKLITIAVPSGVISAPVNPNLKRIMFGPGSIINPQIMEAELEALRDLVGHLTVYIHEHAAVVTEEHRAMEAAYGYGIGSTMKGVGEAVIQKLRRKVGRDTNIAWEALRGTGLEGYLSTKEEWNAAIDDADTVILEGAQGFSLSLNQGFYPYTTSRDCTTHQLLSDCAIPAGAAEMIVYGVCRTYPIRVANRFDNDGKQVGWSGPCYHDQEEIQWSEIGIEPELTTVTKLPRRLFTWSDRQIADAVRMNGIDRVFLNFANYDQKRNGRSIFDTVREIEKTGAKVGWIGHGPAIQDVQVV